MEMAKVQLGYKRTTRPRKQTAPFLDHQEGGCASDIFVA